MNIYVCPHCSEKDPRGPNLHGCEYRTKDHQFVSAYADGALVGACRVCGEVYGLHQRPSKPRDMSEAHHLLWKQEQEIERLRAQLAEYKNLYSTREVSISELRAALEWYAKADYDQRICNDGDGYVDVWGGEEILEDKGQRAREALRPADETTASPLCEDAHESGLTCMLSRGHDGAHSSWGKTLCLKWPSENGDA
jgi:hypothetical protein